jgi:hypothetical protein
VPIETRCGSRSYLSPPAAGRHELDRVEQPGKMQLSRFRFVPPLLAAILALGAADAAAREWVATERLGTVLQLTGDSWEEVERDRRFADGAVIRTLQRGQLRLESGADRISIGRNTVVELVASPDSAQTFITQHAGRITLEVRSGTPALHLLAAGLSVAPSAGVVQVQVVGDTAWVAVSEGGEAVVTDRGSGQTVTVASGGAVTGGGGMALAHAPSTQGVPGGSPPGSGPGAEPGAGSGPAQAGGNPGGGGGGGGNAGGKAGGGGNAGGNSGGGGGPPPGSGRETEVPKPALGE